MDRGGRGGRGGRGRGGFTPFPRGGRGGGRGGFRGGRGGRGGSPSPDAHQAAKKSSVPSFPVVSREDAPAPVSARASQDKKSNHRQHDEEDFDAPPMAVSARRHVEDEDDVPPPPQRRQSGNARAAAAPPTRGGRGGRGGSGHDAPSFQRGRGRGRGGPAAPHQRVPPRRDADEGAEEEPQERPAKGPTRVITTVTESGTELPKKLNTKVFIDGLPWEYSAEPGKPSLEDEVLQFASAWKVGKPLRLIKKPGQGFGFLVMQSPNSVSTAVRVLNGRKFLGRTLRVEEPKAKDFEKMNDIAGMKDMGKSSFARQVLLTDLAKVSQPEIIREVLRDVAPQLEKKLEAIKMTSRNRKAFLTFEEDGDVDPAIRFLDGFNLLGRRIVATQAAAPGSLPYSRGGQGPLRPLHGDGAAAGEHTHKGDVEEDEDGDDLAVVPLGLQAGATPRPTKKAAAAPAPAAAAAKGSNITGRTEKYNLLDDGDAEVYVGNLGDDVTPEHLRQHFASCGKIASCDIIIHPETHASMGIARIRFALPAYAAYAKEHYHGSRLRGCVLRVDRGESASAPLAADAAELDPEEVYDEEGFLAKYGVRDKKKFFKGTTVGKEMGIEGHLSSSDEDEDEELDAPARGSAKNQKNSAVAGKKRTADSAPAADASAKNKKARVEKKKSKRGADNDEDDDDFGLFASGMLDEGADDEEGEMEEARGGRAAAKNSAKGKKGAAAKPPAVNDDDDDDEERFFDADTVKVASQDKKKSSSAGAAGAKKKNNKKNKYAGLASKKGK